MSTANDLRPVPAATYSEEYFLTECEGYAEFLQSAGDELPERLAFALGIGQVAAGMRILDLGCGRGELLLHCARLGAVTYGIDYAPAALRLASQSLSRVSPGILAPCLLAGDVKSLMFPNGVFDRVFLLDVAEHLHPWELAQLLAEVHRVLKLDGRLVIHTMPNRWYYRYGYPLYRLFSLLLKGQPLPADPRQRWQYVSQVHVNEQDPWSLGRALRRAGFTARVWLSDMARPDEGTAVPPLLKKIAVRWVPFKWFFGNDIFAVARRGLG